MKKIRIGSVGLGRLGYEHAVNIATQVAGAELTAICDLNEQRVKEVAAELNVPYTYTDFEEMCKNEELDAIAIVSPSFLHTKQIEIALNAGKHVFCDKPLGTTVEQCKEAEKAVEAHPDKVFMLGFMRRYDASYMDAKKKIESGDIGRIILVRSYSIDPISAIEGVIAFGPHSGGQFLDMCVHDIDLLRWFTGSNPRFMMSMGACYEFEEFKNWNDGDNVSCAMQFEDETMAFIFAGRAAAHGSHVETEIIGTRGTIRIASVPAKNHLEIMDQHGVRREAYQGFVDRWHDAYVTEMNEFVNCINENRKPGITVYDGTAVSEIAYRCKESFETKKMLPFRD